MNHLTHLFFFLFLAGTSSAVAMERDLLHHNGQYSTGSRRELSSSTKGSKSKSSKSSKKSSKKIKSTKSSKSANTESPITDAPTASPTASPVDDTDRDESVRSEALATFRFNKASPRFEENRVSDNNDYVNGVHQAIFPLVASDYPIGGVKGIILRFETLADAVVLSEDYQLSGENATADKWLVDPVTNVTINPAYPADTDGNPNDEYWEELRGVTLARREGAPPSNFNRWPDLWKDKTTLTDIATAVKGEYPTSIQGAYLETVWKSFKQNYDSDINRIQLDLGQPFRCFTDFIGNQVRMVTINAWTFEAVGPVNFMLKWYFGVPRPEEAAWLISIGDLTEEDGVPADLVEIIGAMDLETAHDYTAYPNGCPMHPAFPAMHSAGSTVSLWLPGLYRITGEQYCEALRVDFATAYARTIAGVHYQQDNLAGLNIGQRLIREALPGFVEENYDYDASQVEARLDSLSFDWNTFDSEACTIDGVPAADFLENAVGGN